MRAPYQQRAQPARWPGLAGAVVDLHQNCDQLLWRVGHGGAVGCSIGLPGADAAGGLQRLSDQPAKIRRGACLGAVLKYEPGYSKPILQLK